MYFYLKIFFSTPGYRYVVMMTKEGSTKFINIMTPRTGVLVFECDHISHIVNMHDFFKNLLFFVWAEMRPAKRVVVPYWFSGHMVKGQDHTAGFCTNVFYSISFDPLHLKVARLYIVDASREFFFRSYFQMS